MHVPFLDLKAQYRQIESEVVPVVTEAMAAGMFIGGPQVTGFEEEFAAFCDSKYCIGVGSGTDALRFALMAAGVGPGDAVVTVPNTFIATTEAISQVGATPVFVDVDPSTHTLDPQRLAELLENHPQLNQPNQPNKPNTHPIALGDYPRPPLRPDGRHGPDSRHRPAIRPCRHRRRLPGARRRVQGQKGRIPECGRLLQLLPRQESRRLRRGRGRRDRGRGDGAEDAHDPGSRAGAEIFSRHRRLQRPPRCDPGRGAAHQAEAAAGLEPVPPE